LLENVLQINLVFSPMYSYN